MGKGFCNINTIIWAFKIATYIRFVGLQTVDVNARCDHYSRTAVYDQKKQNIVGRCYL